MSAQDALNAAALAYAVSEGYTPPVTPPPVGPVYLFDGRATTTKQLPTTAGTGNAVTLTPKPPPPAYDGFLYSGTDLRVAADPTGRYALVYIASPAAGRHNPYNTGAWAGATSAQVNKVRPTQPGVTQWFANSAWLDSMSPGYPDWGTWMSLGYQVILYDQVGLGPRSSAFGATNVWTVSQNAGLVQNNAPAIATVKALKPATLKVWHDFVIGYTPSTGADGLVEIHYRLGATGSWEQVYRQTGPTLEWQNTTGPPNVSTELNDKEGLYYGNWNSAQTPAPTGVILSRGMSRHPSLADAIASLG